MSVSIVDLNFLDIEPPALDTTSPGTTVWSDGAQGPVAFGATRGEWHWLRLVGAGSYRFPVRPSGITITAEVVPEADAPRDLIIDAYYRSIVPLALQAYGFETLHGSGVALPGGVVAMCADRETGKSTIAYALQRRGHGAVADDSVVLSIPHAPVDTRVEVHALPFELRLRTPTAQHFEQPDKRTVRVDGASNLPATDDLHLAAIVMLSRHSEPGPVTLTRLSANEAFMQVLSQSFAFTLIQGDRKREMMRSYLRLVNLVPVHRLSYPTGLEHLDAICDRIEALGTELPR